MYFILNNNEKSNIAHYQIHILLIRDHCLMKTFIAFVISTSRGVYTTELHTLQCVLIFESS